MRAFLAAAALAVLATPALAQRADDNAVREADDAFGTSVGNEQIGLYNPFEVRGFSAIDAGNVRIDGLYFDRQYDLGQLISPGNTMRVGISAQGYPLPAPTGIVDNELVRVGDKRVTSVIASVGPFGSVIGEIDMKLPIVPDRFGIALGVSGNQFTYETGGDEKNASFAVAAQWRPVAGVEIIPFFGRAYVWDSEQPPLIFVSGPFLPPRVERGHFYGQDQWARSKWSGTNYGVVNTVTLDGGWAVKAGLFRSIFDGKRGFADLFLETGPTGLAQTHLMVVDPPTRFASTSGEARMSRTFDVGATRNTLHVLVRGRDQRRRYGGSDLIDLGPAQIGVAVDLPKPAFTFGPQTRDEVKQWTGALAYQGRYEGLEVSLGLQRTRYRKTVTAPAAAPLTGRDNAWLYSVAGAWHASKAMAVYGSYTTGLEEGGVAPPNAANKDSAPPAIRTKQVDAGVRYAITPQLKVVAGVFDIEKPYYNLDGANLYRRLGMERHRGAEFSVTGQLVKGLNVVAGTVLMRPRVTGEEVQAGLIGRIPVAQVKRLTIIGADWQTPIERLSLNATLTAIGAREASSDNRLQIPSREVLDVGARYRFEVAGKPATVRFFVGNVFNTFGWRTNQSAVFTTNAQRRYQLTLAADF